MKEYHKIVTVLKRDPATKHKTLLMGDWACPEFGYLAECPWVFTEKVDGTNIRVMFNSLYRADSGNKVTFGGKTEAAQIPAFLVNRLQERFLSNEGLEALSRAFPDGSACLYGEGYGAKIQKGGGNYRSNVDFVLFDVRVGDFWLRRADVLDVAIKLDLEVVPVIGIGTLHEMARLAQDGIRSEWGDFPAEGIVARPATELCTRSGHRIITKIKHRDFGVGKAS